MIDVVKKQINNTLFSETILARGEFKGLQWKLTATDNLYIDGVLFPFKFKFYGNGYTDSVDICIRKNIQSCIALMQLFKVKTRDELQEVKN
jgi:hypothetical protein